MLLRQPDSEDQLRMILELGPEDSDPEKRALGLMVHAALRHFEKEMTFLKTTELSEEMIETTRQSYDDNRDFYGYMYEMKAEMANRTRKDYLSRFIKELKVRNQSGTVLVIGSGNGRDVGFLKSEGFHVHAIEYSKKMSEATKDWANGSVTVFNQDIRDVNFFSDENHNGILAESALEHVNHSDVYNLVERFYRWLVEGGVLLVRLKVSQNGQIYRVVDGVGERYFSSWTHRQIEDLVRYMRDFFPDIEQWESPHADDQIVMGDRKVKRPNFHAIMAKK